MVTQDIQDYVRQQIQASASANRFQLNSIPRHIHNGVDSPTVFQPVLSYSGLVGVPTNVEYVIVTVTGAFAGGETSATLTGAWVYATGVYTTYFSNTDVRSVTYTNGSTHISWSGALSSAATTSIAPDGVNPISVNFLPIGWTITYDIVNEIYIITHNLGTDFYAMTAVASQSSNVFAVPVISAFANEFEIKWADIATGANATTGFYFTLTVINNKKTTVPSYYGTDVT